MLQLQRTSGRRQGRVCKRLFCMRYNAFVCCNLLVSDDVQALLDTGLTSHGKVQSAHRSLSLQQVANCQPQQRSVLCSRTPQQPTGYLRLSCCCRTLLPSCVACMHARQQLQLSPAKSVVTWQACCSSAGRSRQGRSAVGNLARSCMQPCRSWAWPRSASWQLCGECRLGCTHACQGG